MKHLFASACLFAAVVTTAFSSEPAPFAVSVSGHGRPIVLIPGLNCPGAVWDTTVAHLQAHYECHVLSLAGFGGVPAQHGSFVEPKIEAIAAYIRDHQLDHPVVIGHSLGGFMALRLASAHPALVGPVVVVDAYPFLAGLTQPGLDRAGAEQAAARMRTLFESMDDASYAASIKSGRSTRMMVTSEADHDKIVAWGLASDRAATTAAMAEMYAVDLREDLVSMHSPTLVLATWVAFKQYTDHAGMQAIVEDQYAKLPGVKVVLSDSARHFIMFDDPQWMFAQIDAFLGQSAPVAATK